MRKLWIAIALLVAMSTVTSAAWADTVSGIGGWIDTERFGYTGTVYRYETLADLQAGTAPIDTVAIGNRDVALWFVDDPNDTDSANIIMGSWWYSTGQSGSAGWGNTRGNTGVGFMQLYDSDSSTDTSIEMSFSDWDGSYYTTFNLDVTGENAGADDYSRFSVYDNTNDGGIWHEYALSLTATGLQGEDLGGRIIASDYATGVNGSFSGIFELTENQTSPDNQGFYLVELDLNMDNWAWANRDDLTYPSDGFYRGSFGVIVPEPATMSLLGLGVGGLVLARIRRKRS